MDVILITDAEGEKAYDKYGEEIKLNKMEEELNYLSNKIEDINEDVNYYETEIKTMKSKFRLGKYKSNLKHKKKTLRIYENILNALTITELSKLNKMENKELIKKAKEIILKGARQVNIELPEFEIDIEWDIKHLKIAVDKKSPRLCFSGSFDFEEGNDDDDIFWYWDGICKQLPLNLNS